MVNYDGSAIHGALHSKFWQHHNNFDSYSIPRISSHPTSAALFTFPSSLKKPLDIPFSYLHHPCLTLHLLYYPALDSIPPLTSSPPPKSSPPPPLHHHLPIPAQPILFKRRPIRIQSAKEIFLIDHWGRRSSPRGTHQRPEGDAEFGVVI